jgi:hypothetical protein
VVHDAPRRAVVAVLAVRVPAITVVIAVATMPLTTIHIALPTVISVTIVMPYFLLAIVLAVLLALDTALAVAFLIAIRVCRDRQASGEQGRSQEHDDDAFPIP